MLSARSAMKLMKTWIISNLCTQANIMEWNVPWSTLFISIIWQLWKSRNDFVFNNLIPSLDSIVGRATTWTGYYADIVKPVSSIIRSIPLSTSWRQPDVGWTCLNVDGVVSPLTGAASIGGLFRNSSGLWLSDFQKVVGTCHPLQAELWAIFTGLEITWAQGFELLELQSDCVEAVTMINSLSAERSPLPLV
ncbi:hypothetical protein V6N11_023473 [Hibiscus sabdariffa]|uniref:RNase H type-1 domain-containing protein n=1 Tax=Hibiscus sabdariffa TaxID=183260 RepID=A0ABR2TMU2_9ROSI